MRNHILSKRSSHFSLIYILTINASMNSCFNTVELKLYFQLNQYYLYTYDGILLYIILMKTITKQWYIPETNFDPGVSEEDFTLTPCTYVILIIIPIVIVSLITPNNKYFSPISNSTLQNFQNIFRKWLNYRNYSTFLHDLLSNSEAKASELLKKLLMINFFIMRNNW